MSEGTVDKSLLAFLNGLSKRLYFGQKDLTDDFLRNEVLGIEEEGQLIFMHTLTQGTSAQTD